MGADQQLGVVVFAQLGCEGPRKLFGGQRERRVDAGLVATWILPVPTALQVNGNESMHIEGGAIVSEPLVAQPGRDTFGPEQGSEKMCLGETETDALPKCLRSAHGDPGILDVPGVTHPVTHVLKCRPGEGHIVGVLSPQSAGEPPDRGVGQVDDFIPGQVLRRCKSLQLQDLLLVHDAVIIAGTCRSRAEEWRNRSRYARSQAQCKALTRLPDLTTSDQWRASQHPTGA